MTEEERQRLERGTPPSGAHILGAVLVATVMIVLMTAILLMVIRGA